MNTGKYVFSQIVDFLPKMYFYRLLGLTIDRTMNWSYSYWIQLLTIMYGQLSGCASLRELELVLRAHSGKSFHLGLGQKPASLSVMSRANMLRDYKVFETLAVKMTQIAQSKLEKDTEFKMKGKFYAFDSTTITMCLSLFNWANFKSTKSGIKIRTQIDIVTQIPVFLWITNADVADVNAMDMIDYQPNAFYVFDRGYWDLKRLYNIELIKSRFVIREKGQPDFTSEDDMDLLENGRVVRDMVVRFDGERNRANYPSLIRRIEYYVEELNRTFVYYTNDFYMDANNIALLYKNRWSVELFFKWIKQHLRVKVFWGNTENAVRIQIYTAIITYCLVGIIKHELKIKQSLNDTLRILGNSLLVKDELAALFRKPKLLNDDRNYGQLTIDFNRMPN